MYFSVMYTCTLLIFLLLPCDPLPFDLILLSFVGASANHDISDTIS